MLNEPVATALLITTFGALMAVSIVLSRASARIGLPVVLIFLTIGMIAGSDLVGGIRFDDHHYAFRLGTAALALILFDGGLNTPLVALRQYGAPAAALATIGVVGTAALTAVAAALFLGFSWPAAMLLGAVISSTDAATVFAVLRASGISLKRRVGVTLEVEAGLNDPMAVVLTVILTRNLARGGGTLGSWILVEIAREIVVGLAIGMVIGYAARTLVPRARLPATGLYPALSIAVAFLAYGVPTLMHGSGFLAVYVAGVVFGSGTIPYRVGVIRVHDAAAWLSQIAMFLMLGLLIDPATLPSVAAPGLAIALFVAFVARPIVVALSLAPFRYPPRDIIYVGWVGLRGAVPIILALYPVLAGVPGATLIFQIVFFVVVVNAILPGLTVPWVTRRFGLESADPPSPPAVLEIESLQPLSGELQSFYIDELLAVAGNTVGDLPFPDGAAATLIVRGQELVAPLSNTILQPGDHVYVLSRQEDRGFIQLMFGRPEE
jgi:cell volume regulation protein A